MGNINPYLKPAQSNTIVLASSSPLNGLPAMAQGSRATDGGHLILNAAERTALLDEDPAAEQFIRKFAGSKEFINGIDRYCHVVEARFPKATDIDPVLEVLTDRGWLREVPSPQEQRGPGRPPIQAVHGAPGPSQWDRATLKVIQR